MAGSINKVILIGNVGQDPEIKTFNDGNKVANFSLATSQTWKDKNSGERKEKTEWHRISVHSQGLVKVIESWVSKGSKLYLEGRLQTRKWQDKTGQDRYSTEVVLQGFSSNLTLLTAKGDRQERSEETHSDTRPGPSPEYKDSKLDDEIPF